MAEASDELGSLPVFLVELLDEEPVYDPVDQKREFDGNTWWLSRTPADTPAALLTAEQALYDLARNWLEKVSQQHPGSACTFYCWYDEQAGQLRLSLTSSPPSALPFGSVVALLDSPRSLLQRALADPSPGIFSLDEMVPWKPGDPEPEQKPYVLPVWSATTYERSAPQQ